MKRRKKTDPTTRLIEAMLDIALLAGLIRNGVLSSACLLSRDTPRSRTILERQIPQVYERARGFVLRSFFSSS